jgi:hypothetical protein
MIGQWELHAPIVSFSCKAAMMNVDDTGASGMSPDVSMLENRGRP